MSHYQYHKHLQAIWEKSVKLYRADNHDKANWYTQEEQAFLAENGISIQEMYDFAEDFVDGGEPDFTTVAMIQDIRRSYFRDVQKNQPSEKAIDPQTLPPKDAEVNNIVWLPRIIVKAKAKLRGELHPDMMYSCGGDRRFFKTCDIHPAEFLRIVSQHENDDDKIIDWVVERSKH